MTRYLIGLKLYKDKINAIAMTDNEMILESSKTGHILQRSLNQYAEFLEGGGKVIYEMI